MSIVEAINFRELYDKKLLTQNEDASASKHNITF